MEDTQLLEAPAGEIYRCPGDNTPIDRATHLGRLAAFYAPCRQCVHRSDIQQLSPPQARQWAAILRRSSDSPRFGADGFEADSISDLSRPVVTRFCRALAALLCRRERTNDPPAIAIGSDGHWTTAELIAAACEALELAGCRTIEAAALTTAPLVAAAQQARAQACLWIGNPTGRPHAMGLRVWGGDGRPWSSPGTLDAIHDHYTGGAADRQCRRGGGRERIAASTAYLDTLAPMFHGLRPLRIVVDTVCEPWRRDLARLAAQAACELLRRGEIARTSISANSDPGRSYLDRRLELLGAEVVAEQAHFGVWIDGAGAACRIVDERGKAVLPGQFFGLLAAYVCSEKPGATLVIAPQANGTLPTALAAMGAQIFPAAQMPSRCSKSCRRVVLELGLSADGACWWSGMPPAADALLAVSLLLRILSQSDRALSEVLDAGCALR